MFKNRTHAYEVMDELESKIRFDGGDAHFVWEDSHTWRTLPTVGDLMMYISALNYVQGSRAEWLSETDAVIYYQ